MESNQPPDPNMACGPNLWPPYPEPWRAPYQWYGPYVPSPGNGATTSATWNMPWPPPPPPPPPTPGNYHQAANVSHYQSNEQHYHTTTYGQHPVSPLDPTPSFKTAEESTGAEWWRFGNNQHCSPMVPATKDEAYDGRAQDRDYLNGFVAERCADQTGPPQTEATETKSCDLNISSFRQLTRKCVEQIEHLNAVRDKLLKDATTVDEPTWKALQLNATHLKRDLEATLSAFTTQNLQSLRRYIGLRCKKRERLRKQKALKRNEARENIQRTKNLHKKIDDWQEAIRNASLSAEMERNMKKEADTILSEVRRKRAEANKLLEIVKSLITLRNMQKSKAESKVADECDERFSNTTRDLTRLLAARLSEYGEEERALQVMLDEEHQVTRTSAMKKRQQEQIEKLVAENRDRLLSLFGCKEHPTFWNYHTMAARNLEALVHVRQCWDSWLVSSDSTQASSIPLGWVIPVKPSSEPWHLYLDKNP